MRAHPNSRTLIVLVIVSVFNLSAAEDPPSVAGSSLETLRRPDGRTIAGRLTGDAASGFRFSGKDSTSIPLETGTVITFAGSGPAPTEGSSPFRVDLGRGGRLSGRLIRVDDSTVHLVDSSAGPALDLERAGVRAVVQRTGEVLLLDDGFEQIDRARWTLIGGPEVVADPHVAGGHSVRIGAGGGSLTARLPEPVPSGRLEIAFHDGGQVVAGHQWFVDLLFRGYSGSETVRAVLGWSEESFSVESPGGPALAVQRLARTPGWHRLSIRFGTDQTEIAVDGNDLAHGRGAGGPLVEIRLASHMAAAAKPSPGLFGYFDDLRLVRFADAEEGQEADPEHDEVRLAGGDQLFGSIRSADGARVTVKVDDQTVVLPWSEVSGLDFRRQPSQGRPIEGLLVRIDWRAAPGNDPRDLDQVEGALTTLTDSSLTLNTPYVSGPIVVARERLRRLEVVGQGRRIVIDPTAHHLGDEIVAGPSPLDPPQPEGGTLERSFELTEVPPGAAFLTLDVLQVVGEEGDSRFSAKVKKGELRTSVLINGKPVDYLNRHVSTKNETPERIRLSIPGGLLRSGTNRLRLEQVGEAENAESLDDLGILELALEFSGTRPNSTSPVKP